MGPPSQSSSRSASSTIVLNEPSPEDSTSYCAFVTSPDAWLALGIIRMRVPIEMYSRSRLAS